MNAHVTQFGRSMTRRQAAGAAAGAAVLAAVGWAAWPGGGRAAIARVYAADRELSRERDAGLTAAGGSPALAAAAIRRYRDRLGAADMGGCPADFQAAFRRHARAWGELEGVVAARPDGILAELLTGAVNGLLNGEMDGGAGRMDRDLKAAVAKVRDTWEEVERVGAAHGVAPPES